jgi:segregation and condensation protein B
VIFSASEPVGYDHLRKLFEKEFQTEISHEQMRDALDRLTEKYENGAYAFGIVEMNNGYLFMSRPEYHHIISEHLKLSSKKKLTKTAIETLAIVAYKQPVTRADISSIRGVNSDYILQKLLEKELIEIAGRSEEVGRPLLYKTSERFLEYFGLRDIKDLPKLREMMPEKEGSSIGEPAPVEADFENQTKKIPNEDAGSTTDQQSS